MATKKSFVLFTDRKKEIDMLSDAQCGVLFKAILRYADTGERLESDDLVLQVLFSVFASQIDSCNEKWEAIKKKRSEAGKKGMKSRWGTKPKQEITNDNNVISVITSDNKPKQTITKITVTDTVTGTVTVPVTNKPPDGTAPNGAAPPAISKEGDVVPWDEVDFDLV
ncbi:MAG: DUF6291 domain-containing protein [Ruminococcus sp.]